MVSLPGAKIVPKEDFSRKQERDEKEEPKAPARLG